MVMTPIEGGWHVWPPPPPFSYLTEDATKIGVANASMNHRINELCRQCELIEAEANRRIAEIAAEAMQKICPLVAQREALFDEAFALVREEA